MIGRRGDRDRGAVLVEAALVLPLLLFLFLGFFDFTWAELKESDATNAARDGARVGILGGATATTAAQSDCTAGDAAFEAICNEVKSNLTAAPVSTVQVQCYDAVGSAVETATAVACDDASLEADRSTIEVIVVWERVPMTFVGKTFFGESTVTTKSRMVIVN
jgi:Flp pilus assembly protein TadG